MSEKIRFTIALPRNKCLRYYQGDAQAVSVVADDGRRIQFPARYIRAFITEEGLHGRFEMELDNNRSMLNFRKL